MRYRLSEGARARHRWLLILFVHLGSIALANYGAFLLRFDGTIPNAYAGAWVIGLPSVLLLRGLAAYGLGLFRGTWLYAGVWDIRNVAVATGVSTALLFVWFEWLLELPYPHGVYLIDSVLVFVLLSGVRLAGRVRRQLSVGPDARRVLIVGAGDAGAMIAAEMKHNRSLGALPVGFVDDDPRKRGLFVNGVRVYGPRADLPAITADVRPDEFLVAVPSADAETVRRIVATLEPYSLPVKILPSLAALLNGNLLERIRPLEMGDLLARPPFDLNLDEVRALVRDRCVLVTGAGGSIGAELSRQVAELSPRSLIMVDRYENGLYQTEQDVLRTTRGVHLAPVIADVTDRRRMHQVFGLYGPEVVFHAAAHKHVPLMEENPCEAVKNNVTGTRVTAELALESGVRTFILISTDKAVNPTSVMGATKRVAESVVQVIASKTDGAFASVRFGNVLGSNGSVVPLFMRQIESGGPITVTHPEVRRFFMLTSEAVRLVLHAASMARHGNLYILDMGEQIRITDLARNLIRLAGFKPGRDIKIKFVGLRPGEKLAEEIIAPDETLEPLSGSPIFRVRAAPVDAVRFAASLKRLEAAAILGDAPQALSLLGEIVPSFQAGAHVASSTDESRSGEGVGPALADATRVSLGLARKSG